MKFWNLTSGLKGYCSLLSFVDEYPDFKYGDRPLGKDLILDEARLSKSAYKVKRMKWKPKCDFVDTGFASLYILSPKVVSLLEENGVSGWRPFEIELNKPDADYDGHKGLSIYGRCSAVDYSKLRPIKTTSFSGKEEFGEYYAGYKIDESDWDGSDIFIIEGSYRIMVTDRVRNMMVEAKITNVMFEAEDEMHFFKMDVEKHLKNN